MGERVGRAERICLVEGTKQYLAAVGAAPLDVLVVGMSGCWGWSSGGRQLPDLARLVTAGSTVYVCLARSHPLNSCSPNSTDAADATRTAQPVEKENQMSNPHFAATFAERARIAAEHKSSNPPDPLAGCFCQTDEEMTEDRHGNPADKVTIRSWYRKGTMTLVATQYDDEELRLVPTPPPAPLARGGELGWGAISRKP